MAITKSKPTKRPTTKSTKSPAKRGLVSSRFKFNKLGVLALAAVLSIGGAVYVLASHAASGCALSSGAYQCYYNSAGIHHTGGGAYTFKVYYPSIGYTTRTMWAMPSNEHYGWYGPYAVVTAANINVCWWYISNRDYSTGRDQYATFDVTANAGQYVLWSSGLEAVPSSGYVRHNGQDYSTLMSKCHIVVSYGTNREFEVRVKSHDNTGLDIYKTTWQVLD